jgi:TetR/AcrR family transcriptional regulator, transcriptional repressor for nem operon
LFARAPYHADHDPLARVMGYLDFRTQLIAGTAAEYTCLVGTMAQETFLTSPAIRDACFASMADHAGTLEADLQAALVQHGVSEDVTASGLALHTQVVLQGAFILSKACDDRAIVCESIEHLRRYLALLFQQRQSKEEMS